MSARNELLEAPPHAVEQALQALGANLRIARLRRNLSIAEVAEKIGVGRRAVSDAERGKPSTGIVVYFAMLWSLGLLGQMADVADPAKDAEGLTLSLTRDRQRGGRSQGRPDDF
jgi:transcriptional regulator with XRE-family HTH domain